MWGGAAPGPQSYAGGAKDRPMRRMRLRNQLKLQQEVIDGTTLYLSPHYRLVPASGTGLAGARAAVAAATTATTAQSTSTSASNMYEELSAQLGALGITLVSADATSAVARQAVFLLVLCPGGRVVSA